ncbi:MAG: T9SS type A sorting domain-containing protein [Dysgonamonadaceae bacterium]|jgi:poly(3-hydroxybutyrate) depolymerase|nr:T9SS type A sorting domain-containing protein [Dysgonamonadaceae bacterium]
MKKKILISLLLCFLFRHGFAENPIRKTFEFDGFEREYLLYIPKNAQEYNGLVIGLHGFNSSMEVFFRDIDLSGIADSLNYVVIAPQALPEQSQDVKSSAAFLKNLTGQDIALNSVWGCGLKVTASILLTAELNKTIDDAGFLDQVINNALSEYTINPENLFLIGTSMGGYMAYQYILLYGNRLSGMVSIVGTMGTAIKGLENQVQVPICDFHSLTDEVVPYTGSYTLSGTFPVLVSLGKDKNEVINYWVNKNEANEARVEDFPEGNGIKVKKFIYPHPEHEVIHYQADGAGHSYIFAKDKGDGMDYMEEILKFLADHTSGESNGINEINKQNLHFYPNPAKNTIHFSGEIDVVTIYDMTGRLLLSQSFHAHQADVSELKPGMYIIKILSGGKTLTGKLLKN